MQLFCYLFTHGILLRSAREVQSTINISCRKTSPGFPSAVRFSHSCAPPPPKRALLIPWKSSETESGWVGCNQQESELRANITLLMPGLGTALMRRDRRWNGKLVSADQTRGPQGELAGRSAKLKSLVDFNQVLIKTEMGFCPYVEQHNSA